MTTRIPAPSPTVRRTATYSEEPGFYESGKLWLYGNVRLLHRHLAHVEATSWPPFHQPAALKRIEEEAEQFVLDGKVLVCGVHNEAHRRAAVVPLRWGSPRIVVFSGGFLHHLGPKLDQEPFRLARLWRYAWDPQTDLAVSRRAPEKLPTYSRYNPSVDRLIIALAAGAWRGLSSVFDPLTPPLSTMER